MIVGWIFDTFSLKIVDQEAAYFYGSLFFSGVSFIVFLIAICLEILDRKSGKILDMVYLNESSKNTENLEIPNEDNSEESEDCQDVLNTKKFNIKRSF